MGQVLHRRRGQMTARQAAIAGGIPLNVPSTTINKVCLSGINSIMMADHAHQRRPGRHRGRRWHGVDDERPVPAARSSRRHAFG
jgi:hypothetical protein